MRDLFDLLPSNYDVEISDFYISKARQAAFDLNINFCEFFIAKYELSNKTNEEVLLTIEVRQSELYESGITLQVAYLLIFLSSTNSPEVIKRMKDIEIAKFLNGYSSFKYRMVGLTEA